MRAFLSAMGRTKADYRLAHLILLLHISSMCGLVWYLGVEPYYRTGKFYLQLSFMAMLVYVMCYMLWTVVRFLIERREQPTAALIKHMRDVLVRDDRYAHALHSMAIFIGMITVFATIKSTIPAINPFSWDPVFIEIDRAIFGGVDPYILTSALFGNAYAIIVINFFYNLWLILVACALVWAAWTSNHFLRLRFMFSALLGWLVAGNILAITFSSVGPCFVEPLTGDNTYAPLMQLLEHVNLETQMVWALTAQKGLWVAYTSEIGAISGISAMPSLHVVFAVTIACVTWGMGRLRRWAGTGFAVIIGIGSVQLGWHYACDGIVGVALALLFWKVSGYLASWSLDHSSPVLKPA
ncbi:phosphatase PAP2 family protein [Sinorhizobium fredii]|uniref:Phosphatidic acid phosphatase protein n=1 Tax=Rhizobium fredii TaxID=380 RepID=A0A2L0HA56_RHIFR|nr:phosphatase PAP2 family protein [Sinorhizobium fredii]AUX77589.1 phosphatidic acid phosphatase protein [Sinorhizobium fredii]